MIGTPVSKWLFNLLPVLSGWLMTTALLAPQAMGGNMLLGSPLVTPWSPSLTRSNFCLLLLVVGILGLATATDYSSALTLR